MANQKPKKSGKKDSSQPEPKKDLKETKETKEIKEVKEVKEPKEKAVKEETTSKNETVVTSVSEKPLKGFFARKFDANENILTIFKTPKIWGALAGEMIGTMLVVMLLLTIGVQPLYLIFALVGVYVVIVGLSGANLNPLVTAGMMASRRMSAIRGVLYMLAQLLGAWIGLIIVNAFRLGSGSVNDLPIMTEITGETFWSVAFIELLGAIVIAFSFARSLKFARRSPLTFALTVTGGMTLAIIFGIVISQSYFGVQNNFVFNPVAALMYQILPTAADNIGELAQLAGLAIAAYVIVPMIGGIVGFYLSDFMSRLAGNGYGTKEDQVTDCVCTK